MGDDTAMVFFSTLMTIIVGVMLCGLCVQLVSDYREKKAKERKELEEAAKMFEQRIALRPKHIGARIGMGAAADVNFESTNSRQD